MKRKPIRKIPDERPWKAEYEALLSEGRGCEAAYFVAYSSGETPMGADNKSAIGRAALGGLRDRASGAEYGFNYRDYA